MRELSVFFSHDPVPAYPEACLVEIVQRGSERAVAGGDLGVAFPQDGAWRGSSRPAG